MIKIPAFQKGEKPPIDQAREVFEAIGRTDFDKDLNHHLRHWFVIAMPGVFMTMQIENLPDNEQAWRVTNGYGPLPVLVRLLPFRLPWIIFQRGARGSDREHILSYDRVLGLTQRRDNA